MVCEYELGGIGIGILFFRYREVYGVVGLVWDWVVIFVFEMREMEFIGG